MNKLTLYISALFFLTLNVSHALALPLCVGSYSTFNWKNCFGTYRAAEGWKYVGEFKNGAFSGKGTSTYSAPHKNAGYKYVGDWKDSKRHGQGTSTYSAPHKFAGFKYVGEFKDGNRHGQGTSTYESGSKYVGDWKDNQKNGKGTYFFASGSKWVGTWENAKLNGYAITYKADGSINQEGIFKDDVFQYAQKKTKLDKHKNTCEEIGFTPKTEGFGECVLILMDRD